MKAAQDMVWSKLTISFQVAGIGWDLGGELLVWLWEGVGNMDGAAINDSDSIIEL